MNFATSYDLNKWWSIIISFLISSIHSLQTHPFTLSFPRFVLICFTSFLFCSFCFCARLHIPYTNGVKEAVRRQEANGVFEWPKGSQGGEKEWGCVNWNHILFSKCSEVITSRFLSCSPPVPFLSLYPLIPPLLPRTFQQVWIRNIQGIFPRESKSW